MTSAINLTLCAVVLAGCTRAEPAPEAQPPQSGQPAAVVPLPANDPAARALRGQACAALGKAAGCEANVEMAVLAGGCFWGMEDILRKVGGVLATEVGYTGGGMPKPGYEDVKTGASGHAESVRLLFDPSRISYAELLEKWFFRMHDPTTKNQQGNDVGSQYRSAIFVTNAEQRRVAEAVIERVAKSGKWKAPIVTEVVDASAFTRAEEAHQDYLVNNPGGYTCHYLRDWTTL
jgi:peptide methionine sulfoxide reductase msrA/msrB